MGMKLLLRSREQVTEGIKVKNFIVENMDISEDGTVCLVSPDEKRWKLEVCDNGCLTIDNGIDPPCMMPIKTDPPVTSTSTGIIGQWAYGNGYLYKCVATDTWIREIAITSW